MTVELPKAYEPQKYEDEMYKRWEESGFFNPDVCVEKSVTKKDAEHFSIVLPPPNVTGTLHMGHAAMLAIEDVMIRYHRMKGDKTLWVPGTDHAAIATESKVEKLLIDSGMQKPKETLGREAFLDHVKKFAQDSHDTIVNQAKKMGASLDWGREAYTLDEQRNLAVRTVFKKMYDDSLIYRGHRLVNWDPKMQSNVADDEIEWKEEKAPFYYFQYGPFVIGTARPETKFGDKYVVMHPDDDRYKAYGHGQKISLEWINGPITATVIKDEAVDPSFGSGVMTITPWHDAVDFEMAERHRLDKEQVIDFNGNLLPIAGEFAGMNAREARKKIVEKLAAKGLVAKVDDTYVHNVATNYRGGGLIEPQIREQWFVNVNKKFTLRQSKIAGISNGQVVNLRELMQQVVNNGQIKILPERFEKVYFHWINNLRDWCISRQIWFGHQIPVWYCQKTRNLEHRTSACDKPIVSVSEVTACPHCGGPVVQDPDTLDTWFSSGLWTFSTLGWPAFADTATAGKPGPENDLANFHPTSVLETGYDILFFWVARMILMTTYTLGDIPFKTVYLHGLVRDEQGRKMSKTLGNIIDPLDMIAKYGTDATRLSLLIGSTPGNDVKLSEEKIAGFRNFANKLWNICRFMMTQMAAPTDNADQKMPEAKTLADKWILSRLTQIVHEVTENIEKYNFSYAGEQLRDFTWSELADWYLEIAKIEGNKSEILNYILNTILKLWHPYMPFVTETIWQEMYGKYSFLMVEKWPKVEAKDFNGNDFETIKDVIVGIRSLRSENKIAPATELPVTIVVPDNRELWENATDIICRLARGNHCRVMSQFKKGPTMVGFVAAGVEVFVDLAGAVDVVKEKGRLEQEIKETEKYRNSLEAKLSNQDFVARAPVQVVEGEKKKLEDAKNKLEKLQQQLTSLS